MDLPYEYKANGVGPGAMVMPAGYSLEHLQKNPFQVLECLVLRFAKNRNLSAEAYVTVMVRLHLAHGELTTDTNIRLLMHNK